MPDTLISIGGTKMSLDKECLSKSSSSSGQDIYESKQLWYNVTMIILEVCIKHATNYFL